MVRAAGIEPARGYPPTDFLINFGLRRPAVARIPIHLLASPVRQAKEFLCRGKELAFCSLRGLQRCTPEAHRRGMNADAVAQSTSNFLVFRTQFSAPIGASVAEWAVRKVRDLGRQAFFVVTLSGKLWYPSAT